MPLNSECMEKLDGIENVNNNFHISSILRIFYIGYYENPGEH